MMKHSTLVRNKMKCHLLPQRGRGTQNFLETKRGEHKKFSLKRGEQKIFMKGFSRLNPLLVLKCSKNLLREHLDYHEKFSCCFAAKNFQYFL